MSLPLDGVVVVVTRPERQAGHFKALVESMGGRVVAFPTLDVEPLPLAGESLARLAPDRHDWVIYTSANAVEFSTDRLDRPRLAKVAAIGRGTARTLEERGIAVDAVPDSGADSEKLLALPAFAAPRGSRILIVKGAGGRDALRSTLLARGADVTVAEVYRRIPTAPGPAALQALRAACEGESPVVAATSVEVLDALLALAPDGELPSLRDARLLLPGERVARAAREHGWRGPLLVAASAEDGIMLEALRRHVAPAGPAGAA